MFCLPWPFCFSLKAQLSLKAKHTPHPPLPPHHCPWGAFQLPQPSASGPQAPDPQIAASLLQAFLASPSKVVVLRDLQMQGRLKPCHNWKHLKGGLRASHCWCLGSPRPSTASRQSYCHSLSTSCTTPRSGQGTDSSLPPCRAGSFS